MKIISRSKNSLLIDKVQVGLLGFDTTQICQHLAFQQSTRFAGGQDTIQVESSIVWPMMQLILAKIFTLYGDPSNSPYIPIFKRFKHCLGKYDMTVLEIISSSETFLEITLSFLKEFAERKSYSEIRDDYQELVMLTMVNLQVSLQ